MLLEVKAIIADPIAAHGELTRLRAENEELLKALEPLAAMGRVLNRFRREWKDSDPLWCTEEESITAGHCRRAAELLKEKI